MKLTTLLLLGFCLHLSAKSFSQSITLRGKDLSLVKIFPSIREQTGYSMFGNAELLKSSRPVTVNVSQMPLEDFLQLIFRDQQIDYQIEKDNRNIIVFAKSEAADKPWTPIMTIPISGQVTDTSGAPLSGVSIKIKGSSGKGAVTDELGRFSLTANVGDVLEISSIGFEKKEIRLTSNNMQALHIMLQQRMSSLEAVTVNAGIFTRNKNSFTGAVATFTGADLKKVGNLNVLQSLRTLDPSFIINPNNQFGSNPNQMPKIEMRGKTSVSTTQNVRDQYSKDPNQPLFILNGMEATMQQIIDLDMNRVASITLLKDAASTALYGSKSANGVVVVELKRPKPGELRISYNNDTRWEVPDLRGYNMMNSAELLEYQSLAGLYDDYGFNNLRDNEKLYNQRLTAMHSGVNSYWLNVPLEQSLTMGHSLSLSGGNDVILYDISLNYRNLKGIMKGSDRNTWGGSFDLSYRKNKVNVSNRIYINGTRSNESPYGSFSQYVDMAPYYKKRRNDGSLNTDRYLETFVPADQFDDTLRVGNPLYNAMLINKNQTNILNIQDQLQAIWDISRAWRFTGAFQINKNIGKTDVFIPAANSIFDQTVVNRKGSYTNITNDIWGYETYLMLTYNQVLGGSHSINGNLRGSLQEENNTQTSFQAEGFPDGVAPNPAFAFGYTQNGKPGFSNVRTRQASALASVNYAYAGKYFADASFRMDGSTVFGSAKKYSPFWALGAGWMISEENFLKDAAWLDILRIRGNMGTSGNQQLGTFASASIFTLENDRNIHGQGLYITALGNEQLQWQKTVSTSLGLDLTMLNNRFNVTVNAYQKTSKPLIVAGSAPASTGVESYPLNVGKLDTKGIEAILRFDVIRQMEQRIIWNIGVTGSFYKSRYQGFSNILQNLNDQAEATGASISEAKKRSDFTQDQLASSLQRYLDGFSPDELWAVRSAGIDPSTGNEIYIKRNGEKSFTYDPDDIVPSGNGRPVAEGVISTNVTIKGFQLGINLRYSLNNYLFNNALYQKVENINEADLNNNQDRRALEMRWKNPGDIAQFRGISILNQTPLSSRFIQRESFLAGESINVSYELYDRNVRWLRAAGLKTVRLSAYANDIFRLSDIVAERGTDYPFSKAVSFNINLFF